MCCGFFVCTCFHLPCFTYAFFVCLFVCHYKCVILTMVLSFCSVSSSLYSLLFHARKQIADMHTYLLDGLVVHSCLVLYARDYCLSLIPCSDDTTLVLTLSIFFSLSHTYTQYQIHSSLNPSFFVCCLTTPPPSGHELCFSFFLRQVY